MRYLLILVTLAVWYAFVVSMKGVSEEFRKNKAINSNNCSLTKSTNEMLIVCPIFN